MHYITGYGLHVFIHVLWLLISTVTNMSIKIRTRASKSLATIALGAYEAWKLRHGSM